SAAGTPAAMSAFSPPAQQQQPKPSGFQPSGPNYFTSVQTQAGSSAGTPTSGVMSPTGGAQPGAAAKKPASGDAFASLLAGSGAKKNAPAGKGPSMADMAKQKSQAGLYGANAPAAGAPMASPSPATQQGGGQKPNTGSSGMDDLLG
ncbi:hypothetical protein KC352_g42145, partial [Hortaea werneckii]